MSATRCESGLIKTETIQTSNQSRSNNLENFHGIPNLHAWLNGSQRRAQTCSCSPSSDHLATSSSRSLFFRFALSNKRWLWQSPALSNSLVGVPRPHCSCPALCSFLLACHTEGVGPSSWGLGPCPLHPAAPLPFRHLYTTLLHLAPFHQPSVCSDRSCSQRTKASLGRPSSLLPFTDKHLGRTIPLNPPPSS